MTLLWIIFAVFVVVTWLPAGAVVRAHWDEVIRSDPDSAQRDLFPKLYVLGWLYVVFVLISFVAVSLYSVIVTIFITVGSIWAAVKGGAPEYWRYIVENAEVTDTDKN